MKNWEWIIFNLCFNSAGVFLKLKCRIYNNDSTIPISDIGENDGALLCVTDLSKCCNNNHTIGNMAMGEWLYPDGNEVATGEMSTQDQGFYKNRDRSVVRLHRRENITSPTGEFCCEVPDATYTMVTVCINVIQNESSSRPIATQLTSSPSTLTTEG